MLTILVEGVDSIPANMQMDVEYAFDCIKLTGDEQDKFLISDIEEGSYVDPYTFIDRFGVSQSIFRLSTGCKAALCLHHDPLTPLSCIEAGVNALSALIKVCHQGVILVLNQRFSFDTLDIDTIDVCYRGKYFTSFEDFASFMYMEWEA